MTYDKKKLYMSCAAVLTALVLVCLIPELLARRLVLAAVTVSFCALVLLAVKKRTEHSLYKGQVSWLLPLIAVFAVSLLFVSGMKFGMYKNTVNIRVLLHCVLPFVVTITASEMTRSVLLMQNNKVVSILASVAFCVSEIAMLVSRSPFASFDKLATFFGMIVFPSISSVFLYHSMSKKYGALPVILYRLVLSLYGEVLPVLPNVPSSLMAFAKFVFPFLVLLFVEALYARKKKAVSRRSFSGRVILLSVLLIMMTLFVMLISCRFRYGMLVIATESMTGTINKGDAIIYEEYDGGVLPREQVIVFEKDGITWVHRIVDFEHINGEVRYYTKGDANDYVDSGYITEKNIVGTTDVTIKYVGFPTLWMRYIFK